ncbi:MAG: transposase [Candidatus Neoclostridium sp.]
MKTDKKLQSRKRTRLQQYDYSACGAYFITICTSDKRNYFWKEVSANAESTLVGATIGRPQDVELSQYGKIVNDAINNITLIYPSINVDHYAIMPDHIHLLLIIRSDENGRAMLAPTVSRVVQQLKGYITKRIGCSIWQKLFFDHVIRNRDDYEEHVKYIYNNPIKRMLQSQNTEELK